MPKPLGEVIKALALKAGAKEDNEQLVNELSAPVFTSTTLSDDLITLIDNGLLSVETAKNGHPDIKKHYTALAFNGLDAELNTLMEELQVPAEVKAVILNERSSTKRAAMLTREIKKLEAAKKNTDDKGEKTTLQKEIDELRSKLRGETDKIEQIKVDYENKIANIHLQAKINEALSAYKTTLDELPIDARNTTLTTLINKTLQDKNAEFKIDENGQLKLIRKDGSNVFGDDHRQWNPQTVFDTTLSQNKLLKVSGPGTPAAPNNGANPGNTNPVVIGNNNNADPNAPKKDQTLKSLVDKSIADLEKSSKVSVM